MAKSFQLNLQPIVCHAFNADASQLVISCNSRDAQIYAVPSLTQPNGLFKLLDTLSEHTGDILGLDWAPKSNMIASCSSDRNAYVWSQQSNGLWKPMLVILKINRAATCIRWSPLENKFSVGSGSRILSVSYFDAEQNWWVSKQIKKPIKSTVTCVAWHPNNALIACGSSDFKARVFGAVCTQADGEVNPGNTVWGESKFSKMLFQSGAGNGGWVHDIKFNNDGSILAWVGHNSTISIANANDNSGGDGGPVVRTLYHESLPFTSLVWLNGIDKIICSGHDSFPMVFRVTSQEIKLLDKLDCGRETSTGTLKAREMFDNKTSRGVEDSQDVFLKSVHQNTINEMRITKCNGANVTQFTTVGRDGLLVFWSMDGLVQKFASLKI